MRRGGRASSGWRLRHAPLRQRSQAVTASHTGSREPERATAVRDEFFFLGVNVYGDDFGRDAWTNNADRLERALAQGSHAHVFADSCLFFPSALLQETLDMLAPWLVPS